MKCRRETSPKGSTGKMILTLKNVKSFLFLPKHYQTLQKCCMVWWFASPFTDAQPPLTRKAVVLNSV